MNPYYQPIRKLSASDDVSGFDSNTSALDAFLQKHAFASMKAHSAQTYGCCHDGKVAGFYSLAVGSATPGTASTRVTKELAKHPVPVMILARLAVDARHQGKGLGRALLKDALLRTVQVADIASLRCLLVHAKDDTAKGWYKQFDFEPSPVDPYLLMLLLKDIQAILA